MDFIRFPVATTNIFPASNSSKGAQLVTEWNMRSRETVGNHSVIEYICGPSYTHSLRDFLISRAVDTDGVLVSTNIIQISEGSALVHGHFVQSLSPVTVDMAEANNQIRKDQAATGFSVLKGRLCIGLRAMYSTAYTMAASIKVENDDDFYEGIQVVILPKNEFILPEDSPQDESRVTAHLKLGEFNYINGVITDVTPNDQRAKYVDAERISNIDDILSDRYVSKVGLNPKKLYVMSGKPSTQSSSSHSWKDYWCDATDSMIIWDANPQLRSSEDTKDILWLKDLATNELINQAVIRYDTRDDKLKMVLPHKQVDSMLSASGEEQYYQPVELVIPSANRADVTGGVLDAKWIQFINNIDDKISTMYRMPGGKMRAFIDVLTDREQLPKPPISYSEERSTDTSYYDTRMQYTFNLLQAQVAQLYDLFNTFQTNLEKDWKDAVSDDVEASLTDKFSNNYSSLDALKNDLTTFQGQVTTLSASIDSSAQTLAAHIESYTALEARVKALEGGGSSTPASSDIQQLQQQITDLQAEVANLKNRINNTIQTANDAVNELYKKMYGPSKDGSSGDVHDIDVSLEQLRSQYDYLYDAMNNVYDSISSEVSRIITDTQKVIESDLKKEIEAEIKTLADQYNISAEWRPGDYVLVARDETVVLEDDSITYPSTMYVVVPGQAMVQSENIASYYDVYKTTLTTPVGKNSGSTSVERESIKSQYNEAMDTYKTSVDTYKRTVPNKFISGYELSSNGIQEVSSADNLPDVYNSQVMLEELLNSNTLVEGARGTPGKDYFVLRYCYPDPESTITFGEWSEKYQKVIHTDVAFQNYVYYSVFFTLELSSDKLELDTENPVILSGGTPYAQEDRIGGFLNVDSNILNGGYVSRDSEGHLRVNDFELLKSGILAYQLGEDRSEGAGLDLDDIQDIFTQYINDRVAFPNATQISKINSEGLEPDVITITVDISSESEGTLNIQNIDSRFNTSVHLKITGSATNNVIINITNCEKLRITLDETSDPRIFLENVCLYYDAFILDRVYSIKGLSLWYQQYDISDPDLQVDGMTVIHQGLLEAKGTSDLWTSLEDNDNRYAYALRQITFASDGTIIGMGIAVTDDSTTNVTEIGKSIFAATLVLPQSIGLSYPPSRLTKQIKVTGNFVTAYLVDDGYAVKDTKFTILTQKYISYAEVKQWIQGTISFYTETDIVSNVNGVSTTSLTGLDDMMAIDGWESGAYHIFYGGAIS